MSLSNFFRGLRNYFRKGGAVPEAPQEESLEPKPQEARVLLQDLDKVGVKGTKVAPAAKPKSKSKAKKRTPKKKT